MQKILTKQEFSFAIILGDLFSETSDEVQAQEAFDLLNGALNIPLPTYFSLGDHSLPARITEKLEAAGEVCPNLFFLGRRGILKTSEGVRLATLGGKLTDFEDSQSSALGKFEPSFTANDARTLHGAHTVDILITNQWPQGVRSGSKHYLPEDVEVPADAQCISDLCSALKPRYHFAPSPAYYSREPFFHPRSEDEPEITRVTRFEALAPFNNEKKEKWFYAFKFDPSAPSPIMLPEDVTPTPFTTNTRKRPLPDQSESYQRYSQSNGHDTWRRPKKRRGQADYTKLENCFFCISSDTLQTHLITSMADESYVTIPRGPLPPPNSPSTITLGGIPGHALIIPHTHVDDKIPQDQRAHLSPSEYTEMQRYRRALCRMVQARANGKLGAVCWEVSRSHIRHVHWQFLPVPSDLIAKGLVEAGFKVAAENAQLPSFKKYDPGKIVEERGDYFRLWIWKPARAGSVPGLKSSDDNDDDADQVKAGDGNADEDEEGTETSMLLPIPSSQSFDIQFGRKVMAHLLGLGARADWHDVLQSEEEETRDAEAFKKAFERYDPSLGDADGEEGAGNGV